jgi:NAD(P)H-hydrate epimerase
VGTTDLYGGAEGDTVTDETFQAATGVEVSAVRADEMREVDRVAVEDVGLALLQMMENAGRNLAQAVRTTAARSVTVLAGNGGNGGGGLACARHLANHDVPVTVVLDREPGALEGAAAHQHATVAEMDVPVEVGPGTVQSADGTVVDALVGYGLSGPLGGTTAELVKAIPDTASRIVSLDVPSGIDATTGERPGPSVTPDRTVTLALPKTGLDADEYELVLADIGIPSVVYHRAGIVYRTPFDGEYLVGLE